MGDQAAVVLYVLVLVVVVVGVDATKSLWLSPPRTVG
jgi:hypothetical protein